MKFKNLYIAYLYFLLSAVVSAQTNKTTIQIVGSAFIENRSYDLLERICDESGGRPYGSEQNENAMKILKSELEKVGCSLRYEKFSLPGWVRGNDEVKMLSPSKLKLKAVALGFVNPSPTFTADLVYAAYGFEEDYKNINAENKVVLVTQEEPPHGNPLLRYEALDIAARHKAKAILFINENPGMRTMAGASNFNGQPAKIPAFSITYEEGKRLQRLTEKEIPVKMEISTLSFCKEVLTENAIVTFKGKSESKIIIGAHFDSWDTGQGAIDNGVGSAILFDVARLLKKYNPENYFTIELVWFNGEELGLWGSRKYIDMHKQDNIAAMINLDMTGSPTGFNAMGFDDFVPFFNKLVKKLNGLNLTAGVESIPYTNSDHMPFMFEGIPTFSLRSHLDEDMYKYYHDSGDSFDKVNKKYLSEAAAAVSVMAIDLASDSTLNYRRRTDSQMIGLFKKFGLDTKLKRQGEWKYKND